MRSDSVENRRKILEVFAQALQSDRETLPSMTDIVSLSGLGRGTVYRHFATTGDILYAYFEEEFTILYSTYEPEWINADDAGLKEQFRDFLLRCADFTLEHLDRLSTQEFHQSEGRKLTQTELRRKIFVTATTLSSKPLKPVELSKWADTIAYCVEPEHFLSGSRWEVKPELSVDIAMSLLEGAIHA